MVSMTNAWENTEMITSGNGSLMFLHIYLWLPWLIKKWVFLINSINLVISCSAYTEDSHHLSILLIISEKLTDSKMPFLKDLCVIFYGLIPMIKDQVGICRLNYKWHKLKDGVFHQEELVTHLDQMFLNNLPIRISSSLLLVLINLSWM